MFSGEYNSMACKIQKVFLDKFCRAYHAIIILQTMHPVLDLILCSAIDLDDYFEFSFDTVSRIAISSTPIRLNIENILFSPLLF